MVLSEVEKKMVLKHGTIQGKKNMLLLLPTCSAKNMVLTLTLRDIFDQHKVRGIPLMALFQVWTQISAIRGRQKSSWRRYLGESLQTSELMFI